MVLTAVFGYCNSGVFGLGLLPQILRESVSNRLRTVLPVGRVMLPLVMFAAGEGKMDQKDVSCTYPGCERCRRKNLV